MAYRRVCAIIGQPVAEFADHIRQLMGENAGSTARVVTFNPNTNESHVVTVVAATSAWGDRAGRDEEFVLTLAENRGYVHGGGGASGAAAEGTQAAKPQGASKGRRTLFKGRVQLSPSPSSARQSSRGGGGGGGRGRGAPARQGKRQARGQRRPARTVPGLSSIAGVCMLCAVAAAGGISFYASYMSQTAEQGTIEVLRAEIIEIGDTGLGRLLDLELYASHTNCVAVDGIGLTNVIAIHEYGDGCNELTGRWNIDPPANAVSYATDTGVHVILEGHQIPSTDNEWTMIEIDTDTASIIHPVRVTGARATGGW